MFKISADICNGIKNNHLKITKALIATFYELLEQSKDTAKLGLTITLKLQDS